MLCHYTIEPKNCDAYYTQTFVMGLVISLSDFSKWSATNMGWALTLPEFKVSIECYWFLHKPHRGIPSLSNTALHPMHVLFFFVNLASIPCPPDEETTVLDMVWLPSGTKTIQLFHSVLLYAWWCLLSNSCLARLSPRMGSNTLKSGLASWFSR